MTEKVKLITTSKRDLFDLGFQIFSQVPHEFLHDKRQRVSAIVNGSWRCGKSIFRDAAYCSIFNRDPLQGNFGRNNTSDYRWYQIQSVDQNIISISFLDTPCKNIVDELCGDELAEIQKHGGMDLFQNLREHESVNFGLMPSTFSIWIEEWKNEPDADFASLLEKQLPDIRSVFEQRAVVHECWTRYIEIDFNDPRFEKSQQMRDCIKEVTEWGTPIGDSDVRLVSKDTPRLSKTDPKKLKKFFGV